MHCSHTFGIIGNARAAAAPPAARCNINKTKWPSKIAKAQRWTICALALLFKQWHAFTKTDATAFETKLISQYLNFVLDYKTEIDLLQPLTLPFSLNLTSWLQGQKPDLIVATYVWLRCQNEKEIFDISSGRRLVGAMKRWAQRTQQTSFN